MRIGTREKKTYRPLARYYLRCGLFVEHVLTEIGPAFAKDDAPDIFITRSFGFDVYTGAVAHRFDSKYTLDHHFAVVSRMINEGRFAPPRYVFTNPIDDLVQVCMDRYFADGNGQHYEVVKSTLTDSDKVLAIADIIKQEMAGKAQAA